MIDKKIIASRLALKESELTALSDISAQSRDPVSLDQQSVGRLSRMDALQQQAMSQATERQRQADLLRIESAKRRLREGAYGFCEECGELIGEKRLEVDPMAEKCIQCAES